MSITQWLIFASLFVGGLVLYLGVFALALNAERVRAWLFRDETTNE